MIRVWTFTAYALCFFIPLCFFAHPVHRRLIQAMTMIIICMAACYYWGYFTQAPPRVFRSAKHWVQHCVQLVLTLGVMGCTFGAAMAIYYPDWMVSAAARQSHQDGVLAALVPGTLAGIAGIIHGQMLSHRARSAKQQMAREA